MSSVVGSTASTVVAFCAVAEFAPPPHAVSNSGAVASAARQRAMAKRGRGAAGLEVRMGRIGLMWTRILTTAGRRF